MIAPVLPNTKVVHADKPVLLWTNPNPTTAISTLNVSMDLSEYKAFIIECWCGVNNTAINMLGKTYMRKTLKTNDPAMVNSWTAYRNFSVDDYGFHIGSSNTSTTCIPQKIWGLKEDILADW